MKSSGSPPTPPDPVATAAAQTASNKDTAQYQAGLNMVDQTTPLGSLTYTQVSPGDGNTPPHYSATTSLSQTGQKSFDLQQQTGEALDNLALAGTGQVRSAMDQPQSYSGLPSTTGINSGALPSLTGIDTSSLNSVPGIDTAALGSLGSFDPSSLGSAPTANQADYEQAQKALYGQFTSRLDPQWQQQEQQTKDRLTQQGITEGSDAWNKAMSNLQRDKTDAYQTAQNNAVTGAGNVEAQQFGMSNQAYQNEVANALNKAGLENTDYGLRLGTQQAGTQAALAQNSQNLASQQAKAQVGQANYGLGLNTQQAENAANLAQRQQGITESNYLRELPINEVSALLNGGQVSQPTFQSTPQTAVGNTNVAGIAQSSFQDAQQNYQIQSQQQNAAIGAVFGAAGSALGGWATGGFKI